MEYTSFVGLVTTLLRQLRNVIHSFIHLFVSLLFGACTYFADFVTRTELADSLASRKVC